MKHRAFKLVVFLLIGAALNLAVGFAIAYSVLELSASWTWKPRELPVRPMWQGLIINIAFYSVIVWWMLAVVFVLRRRRRIKRGLCPACAYPVGTSPVCTECGKPLKTPRAERQIAESPE